VMALHLGNIGYDRALQLWRQLRNAQATPPGR
jgi:hypothetical protein